MKEKGVTMGFTGEHGSLSLSELLAICLSKDSVSCLKVSSGKKIYYIVFKDKKMTGITVKGQPESVISILHSREVLTDQDLKAISMADPLHIQLESLPQLDQEDIQSAKYHWTETVFFSLLNETDGEFEILESAPDTVINFDLAVRDWITDVIPDTAQLQRVRRDFNDFDERLFCIAPQDNREINRDLSVCALKIFARYRPKISLRNYLYSLSEPKTQIVNELVELNRKGIITPQAPDGPKLPDSRPFLRSLILELVDRMESIQKLIGPDGAVLEILKSIAQGIRGSGSAAAMAMNGDSNENLDDLSMITSSIEDILTMSDLDDLKMKDDTEQAVAAPSPPLGARAKQPQRDTQPPARPKKAAPPPEPDPDDDDDDYEDEAISIEDQVAAKVRYRRFLSNVTMAYNRLKMTKMTYYDMLGVPPNADRKQIHKAFVKLIRKINPKGINLRSYDEHYLEKAVDVRDKLKLAYQTLMDPKLKRKYIATLRQSREGEEQKKAMALATFNKGMVAYKEGDFEEASRLFRKAATYDPTSPVYYDMLESIRKEEHTSNATKFFQAGILAFTQKNDIDRAVKLIKKAISLMPNQSTFHLKLADIMSNSPDFRQEAIKQYEISIDLDPGNIELRVVYARFLKKMGMKKEAATAFQEVLKWNSDNLEARKELTQMQKEGVLPKKTKEKGRKDGDKDVEEEGEF